jgi:hypothetical protein
MGFKDPKKRSRTIRSELDCIGYLPWKAGFVVVSKIKG